MDQGYATVNASAFFCNMAGSANRSITELIRLMGQQFLAPEAEPVSVAGSILVALTSVILIEGLDFSGYRHVAEHLRSNASAMPDTLYTHTDFVGDLAQRGRGDETCVTVKLHIGSRHRSVHRHGRADSGMRVPLRGEHDNARRNLGFSGGRLVG
jgi:hypothetical protein